MEQFLSDDGSVAKFIHDDGSETSVKVVKSCSNFRTEDGRVHTEWVDRNKMSIFISSSLGCYMACPFCHLTIKGSRYAKLSTQQVISNIKEALQSEIDRRPDIVDRYVKLSWMGMGDAVNNPQMVVDATLEVLDWLMSNNLSKGLDCVDLSTVLPPVKDDWMDMFVDLNKQLMKYPTNPQSFKMEQAEVATKSTYDSRTPFRLFWSAHSAIQETRDKMVPRAMPLKEAIPRLKTFAESGPNLLLHQLFVEGLNDTPTEVDALLELLSESFKHQELRVLRYNYCDQSPWREWDHIDEAVARIADSHDRLKVQISAGKEVSAACGQFLVAYPKTVKKKIDVVPVRSEDHKPVTLSHK